MKKTEIIKLLFLATCFVVCFASCDEGDPSLKVTTAEDFVGVWAGHSNSSTSCNSPANNGTQPCGTQCNSYTFTKNTFKFTTKFGNHEGDYSIKGDSILMPALVQMGLSKRTFALTDGQLTLSQKEANGCVVSNTYNKSN